MYNGARQRHSDGNERAFVERRRQFWRDLTIRSVHEAIYEVFGAKRGAQADEGAGPVEGLLPPPPPLCSARINR